MPHESLLLDTQHEAFTKVIEFLVKLEDSDEEPSQEDNGELGLDAEFNLVGANVRLPREVKSLLKNQSRLAEEGESAKKYFHPLVVSLGTTTSYQSKELTQLLDEKNIPYQHLQLKLKPGSASTGLVVEFSLGQKTEELSLPKEYTASPLAATFHRLLESGRIGSLMIHSQLDKLIVLSTETVTFAYEPPTPITTYNLLRKTVKQW